MNNIEKMSFRKDSKKWKKTNKNLNKHKKQKQKGGVESLQKRLLCISDLEGCSHSPVMCKKETFNEIKAYLGDITQGFDNHVAFLGDYFDQGPFMMESINGIGSVIDKYYDKGKVHIILGNRDINKFRILYEAITPMVQPKDDDVFGDWKGKFNNEILNDNDIVKKTTHLLEKTYGAPNLLKNIITECSNNTITITNNDAVYIICSIFENTVETHFAKNDVLTETLVKKLNSSLSNDDPYKIIQDFIKNARKIFYYGKLISSFELDTDYNVLMSHGGSYNKYIFNIFYQYTDIMPYEDIAKYIPNDYFQHIETYRKKFAIDIDNNEPTKLTTYKPKDNFEQIEKINSIYSKDFIKKIFNIDNTDKKLVVVKNGYTSLITTDHTFRKAYLTLIALGLNITQEQLTDNIKSKTNYNKFVSPIASCGVIGKCNGIAEQDDEIIKIFSDLNIKCVVNGHVPHCVTVPIIYQQTIVEKVEEVEKVKRVVFVNCDTSNGNTPKKYKDLNKIPLAYVTKEYVGITSLSANGKLDAKETKGYNNNNDEDDLTTPFQDLITDWTYPDTPTVVETSILHPNGKYLNPTTSGNSFKPMEFSNSIAVIGGGRRRICSKKMIRKCKNKLTKKKRHSKQHSKCC